MIPDLVREPSQSESDEPTGSLGGIVVALLVGVFLWVLLAFLGLAVFLTMVGLGYGS